LRARIEPFGTSGKAERLVLAGTWRLAAQLELAAWLAVNAAPRELLMVDASAVIAAEPGAWSTLRDHAQELSKNGVAVRIVAPATGAVPSRSDGMRGRGSELDALRAHQGRSRPALETIRCRDAEFRKDAEVRREGWRAYVEILRKTHQEETP